MYHDFDRKWTLITSSATKNSVNSTIGGVGILMSPRALQSFNSIEKISSPIIIASFNGNPVANVTFCNSPTNVADEDDFFTFYDQLSSLVRSITKHNVQISAGDFNAHLGRNQYGKYAMYEKANRSGEPLEKYIIENNLLCHNVNFRKREGKLWTRVHPME